MVTQMKIEREYVLQGVVVDRATQRGVLGLKVTAWDRDTIYHDMLGQVITDANGAFTIGFDSSYFGNSKPDNGPDVFYVVEMDGNEVLSTFDKAQHNLPRGTTNVKLEIDLPAAAPLGKDYITTEQAFNAVDWWQASDFRGAYTQGKDKVSTVGSLFGALLGDSMKKFNFSPIQSTATREKEIVNQQTDAARAALAKNQVEVSDVQPVSSLGISGNAKLLTGYPLNLKPNDRVTLYEENGVVKYYTLDAAPTTNADGQTVARLDGDVQSIKAKVAGLDDMRAEIANVKTANAEVAARTADEAAQAQAQAEELVKLRAELVQVQQASATKDVQITKLQSDLVLVTKAQDNLASRLPLNRLDALEKQLSQLSQASSPRVAVAKPKAAARPKAATKTTTAKTPASSRRKPE